MPRSTARSTANDVGAPTATTAGMPTTLAFWMISKLARALTTSTCPASGSAPTRAAAPTTLSTALCRPTSSRTCSRSPDAVARPAAWTPPVRSKTGCCWRRTSGSPATTSAERESGSPATAYRLLVRTASTEAEPQTPHALVMPCVRSRGARCSTAPGARVTSTTLKVGEPLSSRSVQCMSVATSSAPWSRPSVSRCPIARSKSSPGVRIVVVSEVLSTRISSGSSTATVSVRSTRAPVTTSSRVRRTRVVTRPIGVIQTHEHRGVTGCGTVAALHT